MQPRREGPTEEESLRTDAPIWLSAVKREPLTSAVPLLATQTGECVVSQSAIPIGLLPIISLGIVASLEHLKEIEELENDVDHLIEPSGFFVVLVVAGSILCRTRHFPKHTRRHP